MADVMIRKILFAGMLMVCVAACNAAPALVYFGDTLEWNKDWIKRQCGSVHYGVDIYEVSGIACSRVTPGYIWMQSDNEDKIGEREDNDHVIATDEAGEK